MRFPLTKITVMCMRIPNLTFIFFRSVTFGIPKTIREGYPRTHCIIFMKLLLISLSLYGLFLDLLEEDELSELGGHKPTQIGLFVS